MGWSTQLTSNTMIGLRAFCVSMDSFIIFVGGVLGYKARIMRNLYLISIKITVVERAPKGLVSHIAWCKVLHNKNVH